MVASLTCGVAYPTVLLDALAAAPAGGAGLERYPPPRARIRVCLAAIGQAGLPGNEQLAAEGDQLGEPDDADGEAQPVVEAILFKPYLKLGKQTLPVVLTTPAVADADAAAERLLAGLAAACTTSAPCSPRPPSRLRATRRSTTSAASGNARSRRFSGCGRTGRGLASPILPPARETSRQVAHWQAG